MRRGIIAGVVLAVAAVLWWLLSDSLVPQPQRDSAASPAGEATSGVHGALGSGAELQPDRTARTTVPTEVKSRGHGSLRVTVTLAPDSAPLPHTAVHAIARDGRPEAVTRCVAITGADGKALFSALDAGPWHLRLDRWPEADVEVKADETTEVTITVPEGITALARVLEQGGTPVPGAEVSFWGANGQLDIPAAEAGIVVGTTDGNGELPLRGLPHLRGHGCWLAASHPSFGTSAARMVASPTSDSDRSTRVIELRLGLGGAFLELSVTDEATQPVANALAKAKPTDRPGSRDDGKERSLPHLLRIGRSGADGNVRLGPLAPCDYRLQVTASGFERHGEPLTVTDERALARTVVLAREARVHGRVLSTTGKPVAGARVAMQVEPSGGDTVSGPDGRFWIAQLSPGAVAWTSTHDEYEAEAGAITLERGSDPELEITMRPLPLFHGRLVDETGAALEGWGVGISAQVQGNEDQRRAVTEANGRFAMPARKDLEYQLKIGEPGRRAPLRIPGLGVVTPREEPWLIRVPDGVRSTAWVEGILVDVAGKPALADRHISLKGEYFTAWPGNTIDAAVLDPATGSFRIGPLPPGRYVLHFHSRNHASFDVPDVVLQANDTTRLGRIEAPASGLLRAEITAEPGLRPVDVMLQVESDRGTDRVALDPATLTGQKAVLPGRYTVTVYGTGFRWLKQTVDVTAGATATVRGLLQAAVRVGLRLHMPAGERSATFTIRDARGGVAFDTEVEEGSASEDYWPFFERGTFQVEAVGKSGRRYATSFKVESLERRSGLIDVRVEPVR